MYADADYANKDNDRRSVSGIAVTLGGTVVSHASKTQRVVSLSTSEAEHIAAGDGVKALFALFVARKISVEYVASTEQHADVFTEALSRANSRYYRKGLQNIAE